jgi:hypothetical protein
MSATDITGIIFVSAFSFVIIIAAISTAIITARYWWDR